MQEKVYINTEFRDTFGEIFQSDEEKKSVSTLDFGTFSMCELRMLKGTFTALTHKMWTI